MPKRKKDLDWLRNLLPDVTKGTERVIFPSRRGVDYRVNIDSDRLEKVIDLGLTKKFSVKDVHDAFPGMHREKVLRLAIQLGIKDADRIWKKRQQNKKDFEEINGFVQKLQIGRSINSIIVAPNIRKTIGWKYAKYFSKSLPKDKVKKLLKERDFSDKEIEEIMEKI